jgi:hypothetical protein
MRRPEDRRHERGERSDKQPVNGLRALAPRIRLQALEQARVVEYVLVGDLHRVDSCALGAATLVNNAISGARIKR